MKRTMRGLFLLAAGVPAVLVATSTGAASRADVEEVPGPVIDRAVGAVGLVRSAGVFGSGWVARADTVITNLHVAKGGTGDIYMDFSDGERIECYTAVGDRDMDLAVLRCETGERSGLRIDTAIPPAGEPVAIVGYPGGEGPTTTVGVITGDRRTVRGIDTVGFTAAIAPGSSGSPVFDSGGRVRAVATFGGGLGVPIEALVPLLDTAEGYPATKAGAEWRLRIRRSVIAALLVGPIAWFLARRNGRNGPVGIAARWSTGAVVATLLLTQAQFAMSGPAHFL
jgi:hypothetical protein